MKTTIQTSYRNGTRSLINSIWHFLRPLEELERTTSSYTGKLGKERRPLLSMNSPNSVTTPNKSPIIWT